MRMVSWLNNDRVFNFIELQPREYKMVKLSKQVAHLLCAGILLAAAGSAGAQSAAGYPNKPVRVIIPYAVGGAITTVMNVLGDKVGKEAGQNFLADYRPGGDTVVGVGAAAKAAPDGYTLLMATSSYLVNHFLSPNLPFDTLKDIAPIAMTGRSANLLMVNPAVASTLKEFIANAKANPGKLNMAYAGSVALVYYAHFMNVAGIKFIPISYKAGPAAVTAVAAGEVAGAIFAAAPAQALIKAGKLKGLAITGDARSAVLPEVPTFAEAGLKEFNSYSWFALLAPSKTPRDIIEKLNGQFRRAQQAPDAINALNTANIDTFIATVDETENFIRAEAAQMGKVIKEAGIKLESN